MVVFSKTLIFLKRTYTRSAATKLKSCRVSLTATTPVSVDILIVVSEMFLFTTLFTFPLLIPVVGELIIKYRPPQPLIPQYQGIPLMQRILFLLYKGSGWPLLGRPPSGLLGKVRGTKQFQK